MSLSALNGVRAATFRALTTLALTFATTAVVVWSAIGCGSGGSGPTQGAPADAGREAADASAYVGDGAPFYKVVLLNNALCDPLPLPVDNGLTSCRILLTGVDAGCSLPGLSPGAQADVAGIDAVLKSQGTPPLDSTPCVLRQETAVTGGCSDEQTTGWCYVLGSCAAHTGPKCDQAICTTAAFVSNRATYSGGSWLACP